MAADIPVAWASIVRPDLWKKAKRRGDYFVIGRYSARPWERWAHTYGFGELWFFDPDSRQLWRGKLTATHLEVAESSWSDSDTRISRRWRKLHLYGPYPPNRVRLRIKTRHERYSSKNYSVPAGRCARLEAIS